MIQAAKGADFWSLRDTYPLSAYVVDGPSFSTVGITLGGRSKSLNDDGGEGVPLAGARLFWKIYDLSNAKIWADTSEDTVAELAMSGFDFRSPKAAELLMNVIADPKAPDSLAADLMARGAPQDRVVRGYPFDASLLNAAISGRRFAMANELIDDGAFLDNGKVDRSRVTRALAHAVQSGSPAMVDRILAFKPALIIRRNDATQQVDPIITFVRPSSRADDQQALIAITQSLLNAGADINSRDTFGDSVLNHAANSAADDWLRWLIAHGAEVNGKTDNASPAVGVFGAYDEDTIVILLEAGADISDPETLASLVNAAKFDHQTKVRAWLQAHGKWPAGEP